MRAFKFWGTVAIIVLTVVALPAAGKPRRTTIPAYSNEEDDAFTSTKTFRMRDPPSTCGYEGCHPTKDGVLNVHLIAHTHDDVGWLKTVDQYYYGSNTQYQKAGVQYILDSVIDELMKDPARRFVYVETAFFWKWWGEQGDQRRHHVRRLVNEGRLQFSGGAWSMNDEATTHYQSIIDQLTWGLRKLNDTFGDCGRPRTGWQIDPFGHSKEMANIFAAAGYDGLLLGRSDYQDRHRRMETQEAEMVWKASDDLGPASDMFTGIMFNTYSPPPGFCFDILCADEPFIDDINSPDYNVDKLVEKFMAYIRQEQKAYMTNHITVTMGGDFTYMDANVWYKNLDKLIKYVNKAEPKINLLYSTPSCYVKALHDAKQQWPSKNDDFFPYASDQHSYWTGYFTSRPTLKYFERKANNFLQVCKQLYAITNLNEKDKIDLNMLRSAMGIMQHHDAVTGTEKQHVAMDYARILEQGIQDCLITTREALNKLMSEKPKNGVDKRVLWDSEESYGAKTPYIPLELCKLNVSECAITEQSHTFLVTVYNPLGHVINYFAKVPVNGSTYIVRDSTGAQLATQIQPISEATLQQLPNRQSNATSELIFYIPNLLPLGYKTFYITGDKSQLSSNSEDGYTLTITPEIIDESILQKLDRVEHGEMMLSDGNTPVIIDSRVPNLKMSGISSDKLEDISNLGRNGRPDEGLSIGNDRIQVTVDPATGLINFLVLTEKGNTTKIPLKQELLYYEGMIGNNEIAENRSSGAYIFRPNGPTAHRITDKPANSVSKGPLLEELHQKFSNWASQTVRIYKNSDLVEFEWLVGPIPIGDKIGKEVISRFTTDLKTNGTFYTDSNGRQLLKRVFNKRPTWPLEVHEPVAGNYYPVTSMITIKDDSNGNQFFVMNDRAQGGSSLKDGDVELMVHRRLLHDDAFGVGEALNEGGDDGQGLVARGRHYVFFGNEKEKIRDTTPMAISKQIALQKLLEPVIFVSPAENLTFEQWTEARNEFSSMSQDIPPNVHLLTLEPWKDDTILVRMEHILQKTDDPKVLSQNAKVNLHWIFSAFDVQSIRETTLGGNQFLEDSKRFVWESKTENTPRNEKETYRTQTVEENKHSDDASEKASFGQTGRLLGLSGGFAEMVGRDGSRNNNMESPRVIQRHRKNNRKYVKSGWESEFEIELKPMEIRTFIVKAKFLD